MAEVLSQQLALAAVSLAGLALVLLAVSAWWAWRDNNPKTTVRRHAEENSPTGVLAD